MNLPNEILIEIFQLALGKLEAREWNCTFPAYVISLVCMRWKQVMYATPQFWTEITRCKMDNKIDPALAHRFLRSRLLRSGGLSVNLQINICPDFSSEFRPQQPLDLKRVRTLILTFPDTPPKRLFGLLGTSQPSFPSLRSLLIWKMQTAPRTVIHSCLIYERLHPCSVTYSITEFFCSTSSFRYPNCVP